MRWAAVFGQSTVLLLAYFVYDYQVALLPALGCILALIALNFCAAHHMPKGPAAASGYLITLPAARASIVFDTIQLAGLLFFTGGIENPFVMLLVVPLTVGATLLRGGDVAMLLMVTLLGLALQFFSPFPLEWRGGAPSLPLDYTAGLWLALFLTVMFLASYVWSVSYEKRRLADALAASETALANARRVNDVGAMAAAVAHELATPLGTITLIAKELSKRNIPELKDDIATLVAESQRCRTIMADLGQMAARVEADTAPPLPLQELLAELIAPHQKPHLHFELAGQAMHKAVPRSAALQHGLSNLLANAADFAASHIMLEAYTTDGALILTITDDGPGFPPALLQRLGEPYISKRDHGTATRSHLGLGIFIAITLLERTGATLEFSNPASGGALVTLSWPNEIRPA